MEQELSVANKRTHTNKLTHGILPLSVKDQILCQLSTDRPRDFVIP